MRVSSLSINGLMTLAAVVEHRSFTRAAESLGVSQAAVSQQVRDLERSCGMPLVVQHGRTLATTALGLELSASGRRIALESRRAGKTLAQHAAGHAGHLTIGASMTTGVYLIPQMIARLREAVPDVHLQVEIANTEDVAQATVDDIVDIGVVEGPVRRPELVTTPFRHDTLHCIISPRHRLRGASVRLAGLSGETLIVREPGSGSREVLLEALAGKNFSFVQTIEIGNPEAIVHAVAAGVGISWVSELAVGANDGRLVTTLDVEDLSVTRTMSFLRRRDMAPSPAMQSFIAMLEQAGATLSPS